jgi:hypothetical protein
VNYDTTDSNKCPKCKYSIDSCRCEKIAENNLTTGKYRASINIFSIEVDSDNIISSVDVRGSTLAAVVRKAQKLLDITATVEDEI